MASGFLRAFIAIDIPDGEAKEKILGFQKAISQTGADLKLVEPEIFHITLRFLGDVSTEIIEELKNELGKVQFKPFTVTLKGVVVFPDYRRINVVCVGIDEGNLGLLDLYNKVNDSLRRVGVPPDRRGLSLHLTVARVRSARNKEALSKTLMGMAETEFGRMDVSSFHLKRSTLTPKGPVYQSLYEVQAAR